MQTRCQICGNLVIDLDAMEEHCEAEQQQECCRAYCPRYPREQVETARAWAESRSPIQGEPS